MKTITIHLAIAVSVFLAGCSDTTKQQETKTSAKPENVKESAGQPDTVISEKEKIFDELPDQAVLISVNGLELTKETFSSWIDLRKKMLTSSGMANKMGGNDPTAIIKSDMLASVTNDYANQIAAINYANEVGIKAETNHIETCRRVFMRAAGISDTSWEKALKRFSPSQRVTINDRIAAEATVAAVSDYFFKVNNVEVEQKEMDALYADYLEYNRICAATNALTWAKATNIWKRITVVGESFEELADIFDEDEYREENGVWGDFLIGDFTDEPQIWNLAGKFRPGWVSPPVEADNGITIVKINSIADENGDVNAAGYVLSPSAVINMSRIFIHLPLPIEETTKEQFTIECQRAKKIAEFSKFLADLVSKADIKYPCGTSIFGSGSNENQVQ